ncbi:MAG TPA: 23S rRNA (uracil(1939)-C(5))-methyltransferase RlmD [Candidatus Melainabacteria bacterium]|nr:23S rRNA (uracil(1939)-C(5))-methyltransferase RlmD [Candidatus Melainabacteria bacterium]
MAKKRSHRDPQQAQAVRRGTLVEMTITSMAPGGEAFGKADQLPVFISRGAPGDVAEVELYDVRKNFAKGKIERLISPSQDRTEPPCKLFKVCGGCQWQHISYEKQTEHKTSIVKQALCHIGGLPESVVEPCIGAEDPLYYRNKVQFPVRNPHDSNRILAGYFKQDSHELVNIKHCPVQSKELDFMLETVKEALEEYDISAYDERKRKGLLRHIHARQSRADGNILLTLVMNCTEESEPEALGELAELIMLRDEKIVGVAVNYNDRPGNRILGDRTRMIAGNSFIDEVLKTSNSQLPSKLQSGLTFRLSPTSFFQVNTEQAARLLEIVYLQAYGQLGEGEKLELVVDAYAGVGAFSLWLAPGCERLIAVEEYTQAVLDGRLNAQNNQISNVEFVEGDVAGVLPQFADMGEKIDLVVLDPPRKGLSPEVVKALLALSPPRIIYVSCNPSTLARDLKYLSQGKVPETAHVSNNETSEEAPDGEDIGLESPSAESSEGKAGKYGYKAVRIQPIDLFPQTYHVESVATLERVLLDGSL